MKHRTGHLFKRGDSYYLRWAVNGQVFSRALRDDQDNPITTKPAAEQAQQKAMASFIVGDEVAALEAIAGKLAGRKTELAAIEDEKNPPVTVAQAWVEYLASPDRPDTGAETLKRLGYQWSAFVAWLKDNHGDVVTLRGVTEDMAREYRWHVEPRQAHAQHLQQTPWIAHARFPHPETQGPAGGQPLDRHRPEETLHPKPARANR